MDIVSTLSTNQHSCLGLKRLERGTPAKCQPLRFNSVAPIKDKNTLSLYINRYKNVCNIKRKKNTIKKPDTEWWKQNIFSFKLSTHVAMSLNTIVQGRKGKIF
uniref:Uncharacterized protein n=1 Tax=Lepeophtheirus salmonis TaxID=72036 RepID=A0A0K2TGK2_LEPSM